MHDRFRDEHVHTLSVSGTNLFAGVDGSVFLSADDGTNWRRINEGLTDIPVRTLLVSGEYLYAGTFGGVWKRPVSDVPLPASRRSAFGDTTLVAAQISAAW